MINPPAFTQNYLQALQTTSFAKYAAPFFYDFVPLLESHYLFAQSCERHLFGFDLFVTEPFSLPQATNATHLGTVCSIMPSYRATEAIGWPSLIRLTASSLNSRVYDCHGTFIASISYSDIYHKSP